MNFFGTENSTLVLDGSSFGYGLNNALKNLTVNIYLIVSKLNK